MVAADAAQTGRLAPPRPTGPYTHHHRPPRQPSAQHARNPPSEDSEAGPFGIKSARIESQLKSGVRQGLGAYARHRIPQACFQALDLYRGRLSTAKREQARPATPPGLNLNTASVRRCCEQSPAAQTRNTKTERSRAARTQDRQQQAGTMDADPTGFSHRTDGHAPA